MKKLSLLLALAMLLSCVSLPAAFAEGAATEDRLTSYEQEDSSAEMFEHAVIADLENRVNELFPTIRFKMFETLINGNVRPTCQLTMHGVPYSDLSNSEKILAGLECVRAMQRHTGVYAPIVIIISIPRPTP